MPHPSRSVDLIHPPSPDAPVFAVPGDRFPLVALPLRIVGRDGSPVRTAALVE
jgi:hypothetical protein